MSGGVIETPFYIKSVLLSILYLYVYIYIYIGETNDYYILIVGILHQKEPLASQTGLLIYVE
jgi:hypothetical protein